MWIIRCTAQCCSHWEDFPFHLLSGPPELDYNATTTYFHFQKTTGGTKDYVSFLAVNGTNEETFPPFWKRQPYTLQTNRPLKTSLKVAGKFLVYSINRTDFILVILRRLGSDSSFESGSNRSGGVGLRVICIPLTQERYMQCFHAENCFLFRH